MVLGVDTRRDARVAALLSLAGAGIGADGFPAAPARVPELLQWARGSGPSLTVCPAMTAVCPSERCPFWFCTYAMTQVSETGLIWRPPS
jgi:hypothetical protein